MLTIQCFIRVVVILLLKIDHFHANSRNCYEIYNKTICYFQPVAANTLVTWDDAWKVCKENNSTLPVIENRMMAETLRKHLESKTSLGSEAWLAGRENRTAIWRWLSGKRFGLQNILRDFPSHDNVYETNAVIKDFRFEPRYPTQPKSYICRITGSEPCQNKTVVPVRNGCLFINNDEQLNLVDARNRCLDEGGDLATFEEDEDLGLLKQANFSTQQKYIEYWIGLRNNWWIWNETDASKEMKYSNWLKYENLLNMQCLYIRLNDYKWNQDHCAREKPFLCQSVSPTLSPEEHTVFSIGPTYVSVPLATEPQLNFVGVVVAISILVLVTLLVVVIVVVIAKKRKRNQHRNDSKCVQRDGSYEDLRRGQDNLGSNDQYMELRTTAQLQTALIPEYQNLSDYDDVVVPHAPNNRNIIQ